MRLRLAIPADLGALVPLVRDMHEHEGIPTTPRTAAALSQLLQNKPLGMVILAEDPAPLAYLVVGFGYSLEFGGRDAFVDELWVDPKVRGQGIGTRLLATAEQECHNLGIHALHLEVDTSNEDATRLYEREGYKAHPRHLMTKWLRPLDG